MTRGRRLGLLLAVVFMGLTLCKPTSITVSRTKQAAAAQRTHSSRSARINALIKEFAEQEIGLQYDMALTIDAMAYHMIARPDDFDGREELWMDQHDMRGLFNSLAAWA